MAYILLTILTLAATSLFWGGYKQLQRGDQTKGLLMIVAGMVALGNVMVWVMPM
jgi:hypothetical protein